MGTPFFTRCCFSPSESVETSFTTALSFHSHKLHTVYLSFLKIINIHPTNNNNKSKLLQPDGNSTKIKHMQRKRRRAELRRCFTLLWSPICNSASASPNPSRPTRTLIRISKATLCVQDWNNPHKETSPTKNPLIVPTYRRFVYRIYYIYFICPMSLNKLYSPRHRPPWLAWYRADSYVTRSQELITCNCTYVVTQITFFLYWVTCH